MSQPATLIPARHLRAASLLAALTGLSLLSGPLPAAAQYYDGRGGFESPTELGTDRSTYDRGYRDEDRRGDGADDGEDAPDVSYFYDELEDEGRWVSHPRYGEVFIPRGIDAEWRPYTRGYWASTEENGWYWVSDEPFGWATYHYGRWYHDDGYGWVWVPGTTWAPAWVAWRSSDDYVGWAPLPPDSYWEPSRGLVYDTAIYESPRYSVYWSFVEPAYISSPGLWHHCAPRHQVTTIIYRTRPYTDYVFVNRRIVNRGVPVDHIRRFGRTEITTYNVRAITTRQGRGVRAPSGRTIEAYRPDFSRRHVDTVRRGSGRDRPVARTANWTDVDRPRGAPRATSRATPLDGTTYAPARATPGRIDGGARRPESGRQVRTRDFDGGPRGDIRRHPQSRAEPSFRSAGRGEARTDDDPRAATRRPARKTPPRDGERAQRGGQADLRGSTYAPPGYR